MNTDALVKSMRKYSGKNRQHLVMNYYYDTFDDESIVKMPAGFFGGLLKTEEDEICKWYEIKALGDYKAVEYKDLIIYVLKSEDTTFETGSSLHSIASYSLGKMGAQIIDDLLNEWPTASEAERIALIDAFGEMRCIESAKAIEKLANQFNDKEFLYATLALSKCQPEGDAILKSLYHDADNKRKLYIIDAIARSSDNDVFINDISKSDPEIFRNALSMNTNGINKYKERAGINIE